MSTPVFTTDRSKCEEYPSVRVPVRRLRSSVRGPWPRFSLGRQGDRHVVLGQHGTDRFDPNRLL